MSMTQKPSRKYDLKARIAHNIKTHQITKPNGKRITVPSSDRYVEQRVLGSAMGLAFTRALVGRDFV
ncbi:hypothetical protein [Burkholderia multivorans]|uniref:hypothetical protein n=1 Tax=Burkholderia multivorans TaxID=87883 RepID=UPI001C26940D|nr:hypothetical protein [Burkholderia multivorans]MBU9526905.1 hypothetical protein [Burkholderia multivorans]HEF4776472.1 hypothetical protein [Burkholderia multivorans]HEF4823718.1 hypothetical protein [Burkholderia multivorans]